MNKLKKGDLVEKRVDVTSFVTAKVIGEVKKVNRDGTVELEDKNGNKLGTFHESELKLR